MGWGPRGGTSPRVIAIVGMHRSGTSWLAGSLQERGLALGDVSERNPHNARGNRENPELMQLHETVLVENGGTWREPPGKARWSRERRAQLQEFIDNMGRRHERWGFKDPRTLLLLDEWLRQAPRLKFVGVFRHPVAVGRSLRRRSESHDRDSLDLWQQYNRRLVDLHRRRPFPLLRFDVAPELLDAQLERAASALELAESIGSDRFFDPALVHHETDDMAVPASCRDLWAYLTAQSPAREISAGRESFSSGSSSTSR